jgi:hypothetical protein
MSVPIKTEFKVFVAIVFFAGILLLSFLLASCIHGCLGSSNLNDPICEDVEITVTSIESSSTFQAVDAEGATCKINMGKTSIAKKLLVGDKLVVTRIRRFSKDGTYYTERFQDVYNKVKELTDGR